MRKSEVVNEDLFKKLCSGSWKVNRKFCLPSFSPPSVLQVPFPSLYSYLGGGGIFFYKKRKLLRKENLFAFLKLLVTLVSEVC